jgi:L-amino acid N-acyltransferase YncA
MNTEEKVLKMIVRYVKPEDAKPLRRLVMHYLRDTYAEGGDFPPTLDNAAAFTKHAVDGAKEGDPCIVGELDGKIIGFVMARGLHFPGMQTRDNTIRSWGSYVEPEYRRHGYGITLYMMMARLARAAGYTRLLGMTHGTNYEENTLRAIKTITGVREVGRVLIVDLVKQAPEDSPAEDAHE